MPVGFCQLQRAFDEAGVEGGSIQRGQRQTQINSAATEIAGVEVGIKVALHPIKGMAFEIAPLVFIFEMPRADAGAGGAGAEFLLLGFREGPVDGLEFVILIFTHGIVLLCHVHPAPPSW